MSASFRVGITKHALALFTVSLSGVQVAYAQANPADAAAAQALFDEARKLVAAGNYTQACPKFEESQLLDAGLGTLLNLADCWERMGRTASAWSAFLEVQQTAEAQGQKQRAKQARERANALATQLSKLKIAVPADHRLPGLRIHKDGSEVRSAQWETALPIDPGQHMIVASAPGKRNFRLEVSVPSGGGTTVVTIPRLFANEAAKSHDAGASPSGTAFKTAGWLVGGAGVVVVGVGSFFGLRALSKHAESNDQGCKDDVCPGNARETREQALSAGDKSTVAFLAGGALIAAGVTLYLVGEKERERSLRMTASPRSLWISGSF